MAGSEESQRRGSFRSRPERQAVDAIAGFVFQVDHTVSQWVQLDSGQVLELERGEDVDRITRLLDEPGQREERLLGQLKRRRASLTLRSPAAIRSIAHLAGHRARNPDMELRLAFVSTAAAGREKKSPLPEGWTGIAAWQRAAAGAEGRERLLDGILSLLRQAKRPQKGVSNEDWAALRRHLGRGRAGVLELAKALDWELEAPDSADVVATTSRRLLALGLARSAEHAAHIQDRLFSHVFRLLASHGPRRLDRDGLMSRIAGPTDALCRRIRRRVDALATRVRVVERRLSAHAHQLESNTALLEALTAAVRRPGLPRATGARGDVEQTDVWAKVGMHGLVPLADMGPVLPPSVHPALLPPPPHPGEIDRPEAQRALAASLASARWVCVTGTSRSGKTTLVKRLAAMRRCAWIRLRGLDELQATGVLMQAYPRDPLRRHPGLTAVFEDPGETDGLVVVDDVPDLRGGAPMADALLRLAHALPDHVRLVTIGTHPRPGSFRGSAFVDEWRAPPFTPGETRALMGVLGAPEWATTNEALVATVTRQTEGHAERLRHALAVLADDDWRLDLTSLRALFSPEADVAARTSALAHVSATVPESVARELLFRL